jgi:hypothetical protein
VLVEFVFGVQVNVDEGIDLASPDVSSRLRYYMQKKPQVLRPGVWKGGPSMKGRKSARG